MLKRWLVLLGLAASGLVAASCGGGAGEAIATAETERLANMAATRAYSLATQTFIAATQSIANAEIPVDVPSNNFLDNKIYVIALPQATVIMQKGKQTYVVLKPAPLYDTGSGAGMNR